MPFDVAAARKAGYSEPEIADFLAKEKKFDSAAAKRSGYTDADIISHLAKPVGPAKPRTNTERLTSAGGDMYAFGLVPAGTRARIEKGMGGDAFGIDGGLGIVAPQRPSRGPAAPRALSELPDTVKKDPLLSFIYSISNPDSEKRRRAEYQQMAAADPWYNAPGNVVDKGIAGLATLAGSLGGAVADPLNLIPGGGGKKLLARMAGAAGVNAGSDVVTQGLDLSTATQDQYDPLRTAASAALGAAFPVPGALVERYRPGGVLATRRAEADLAEFRAGEMRTADSMMSARQAEAQASAAEAYKRSMAELSARSQQLALPDYSGQRSAVETAMGAADPKAFEAARARAGAAVPPEPEPGSLPARAKAYKEKNPTTPKEVPPPPDGLVARNVAGKADEIAPGSTVEVREIPAALAPGTKLKKGAKAPTAWAVVENKLADDGVNYVSRPVRTFRTKAEADQAHGDLTAPKFADPEVKAEAARVVKEEIHPLMEQLTKRLGQFGMDKHVRTKILDWIESPDGLLAKGSTYVERGIGRVIELAQKAHEFGSSPIEYAKKMTGTLDHEALHVMRDMNLISPKEWDSLTREAGRRKFIDEGSGERKFTYDQWAKDTYKDAPDYTDEIISEEAVAEMFKHWGQNPRVNSQAAGVMSKIVQQVRALGRGMNAAQADKFFEKVHAGEIGERLAWRENLESGTKRYTSKKLPMDRDGMVNTDKGVIYPYEDDPAGLRAKAQQWVDEDGGTADDLDDAYETLIHLSGYAGHWRPGEEGYSVSSFGKVWDNDPPFTGEQSPRKYSLLADVNVPHYMRGLTAPDKPEDLLKHVDDDEWQLGFHGGPHDFAPEPEAPHGKFRWDKMGTGEGAQAYGKGHYIAKRFLTSDGYRERLSKAHGLRSGTKINGADADDWWLHYELTEYRDIMDELDRLEPGDFAPDSPIGMSGLEDYKGFLRGRFGDLWLEGSAKANSDVLNSRALFYDGNRERAEALDLLEAALGRDAVLRFLNVREAESVKNDLVRAGVRPSEILENRKTDLDAAIEEIARADSKIDSDERWVDYEKRSFIVSMRKGLKQDGIEADKQDGFMDHRRKVMRENIEEALKRIAKHQKDRADAAAYAKIAKARVEAFNLLNLTDESVTKGKAGRNYAVAIPGDKYILDFGALLEDQPDIVQKALIKLGVPFTKKTPDIGGASLEEWLVINDPQSLRAGDTYMRMLGESLVRGLTLGDGSLVKAILSDDPHQTAWFKRQPPRIQEGLISIAEEEMNKGVKLSLIDESNNWTGEKAYWWLARKLQEQETGRMPTDDYDTDSTWASKALNSEGVKGSKNRDYGSRQDDADPNKITHNYVIFDDDNLRILQKWSAMRASRSAPGLTDPRVQAEHADRIISRYGAVRDVVASAVHIGDKVVGPVRNAVSYLTGNGGGRGPVDRIEADKIAEAGLHKFQDRELSLGLLTQGVAARGGKVSDLSDPYLAAAAMPRRIQERTISAEQNLYDPTFKAVNAIKFSDAELGSLARVSPLAAESINAKGSNSLKALNIFLQARHAKERNKFIRIVRQAKDSKGNPILDGSGMSDAEAGRILDWFNQSPKFGLVKDAADKAYAIIEHTRQVRMASGLSPDWAVTRVDDPTIPRYDNYVPMRGVSEGAMPDEVDEAVLHARTGRGVSISGREDPRAKGRYNYAGDVLTNIIFQHGEAMVRGEKNRVGHHLLRLVRQNPDLMKDIVEEVKQPPMERIVDAQGRTQTRVDPNHRARPDVFMTKVKGKEIGLLVKHPVLLDTLKRLDQPDGLAERSLKYITPMTNLMRNLITTHNPEFSTGNFPRDVQEAALNAGQYSAKAAMEIPGRAAAIVKDLLVRDPATMARLKRLGQIGGLTSYRIHRPLHEQYANIQKQLTLMDEPVNTAQAFAKKSREYGKAALNFIEGVNDSVEGAARLAIFDAFLADGFSEARAAQMAKELTVNFNRMGVYSPVINTAYMFSNATLQGSANVVRALATSPRMRKAAAAIIGLGFATSYLNSYLSPVDAEGNKNWDKIPEWEKQKNFIVLDPFGMSEDGYLKIPLPYTWGLFYQMGERAQSVSAGKTDPASGAVSVLASAVDSFNPLGTTNETALVPTLARPAVETVINKDFTDRAVHPAGIPFGVQEPKSQQYFSNATPYSVWIADMLSKATGGDGRYVPGKVEIHPDDIDHIVGSYAGGLGKFISRAVAFPGKFDSEKMAAEGREFTAGDIPFVRRYIGQVTDVSLAKSYTDATVPIIQIGKSMDQAVKEGDVEGAEAMWKANSKPLMAYEAVKDFEREKLRIRKAMSAIRDDPNIPPETRAQLMKTLKAEEKSIMQQGIKTLRAMGVFR